MKVQKDINIYLGGNSQTGQSQKMAGNSGSANISVFGGGLNTQQDWVSQKRQQAREAAMKVVRDAFEGDKKLDAVLDERRQHIKSLINEIREDRDNLHANDEKKIMDLRESYGISNDSQEQKDLDLLIRYQRSKSEPKSEGFTENEWERIQQLRANGLTEYQSRYLEIEAVRSRRVNQIDERLKEIKIEDMIIRSMKIERLKHSPVLDATKEAEDIMEEAGKEIVSMLYEEGKEHIDEEAEDRVALAEEIAEEQEKQEEFIEKIREGKKEKEEEDDIDYAEEMKKIISLDSYSTDIQNEIKEILNKMKLIEEDIKGIVVDQDF